MGLSTAALRTKLATLRRGPMLHNVLGAAGIQLSLLVSGTLLARLLGPEKRGYLAILLAIPSAVGQLGAVGMSLAATYYLSSGAIGGVELVRLLRRPAVLQIALLTVITAELVLFYAFASRAPIIDAAIIGLFVMPVTLALDYGMALLLGMRRHRDANAIRTLLTALNAIGFAVLYVLDQPSLVSVMAVVVGTSAVVGIAALRIGVTAARRATVRTSLVTRLGRVRARREILAFGRQGYLGFLSPVDSFKLDQLAVGFLLSPRELGIYVVGAAFTNVGRIVATNLGMSATPEIAARNDPAAQRLAVRRTLLFTGAILLSLTGGIALFVIAGLPLLFGATYRSSVAVAEILLVASFFLSMKRIAVDVMRGVGEPRIGSRAEVLNLVVFMATVAPLGLWLGGRGVALALVVSAAAGTVLMMRNLVRIGALARPATGLSGPSTPRSA